MTTLTFAELEGSLAALELGTPIPDLPAANVLNKPLDLYRSYLADILSSLTDRDRKHAYDSISWPNNIEAGDLTVIVPKLRPGAKATEAGFDLTVKFPQCPLFTQPVLDGVQLRIFSMTQTLARILIPYIRDRKEMYGKDTSYGLSDASMPGNLRKKIVTEYSSPSTAEDFKGKHLRSTILGEFISRMHEAMGWDVTRVNYLGDWGKPVSLLGIGWQKYGSAEAYEADPIGHLLEVYHKIEEEFAPLEAARKKARDDATKHSRDEGAETADFESQGLFAERNEYFKRLENGDEEALELYKRFRTVKVDDFVKFYERLGTRFDEYAGESHVSTETMAEIEQLLKDRDLLEESEGAWIVDMKKYGAKSGTAIIRNRSGSGTYLLRELANILERWRKFEFDKMIILVASDHNVHFSRIHKILELIDMSELAAKVQHVSFSEISHMIDKLGQGHKPNEILNKCEAAMLDTLRSSPEKSKLLGDTESVAKVIGITGLQVQELSTRMASHHTFDIPAATSLKMGTGGDFQFWHMKLSSVLKTAPPPEKLSDEQYEELSHGEPANLLRILAQYPDITHAAYRNLEPAAIVAYLGILTDQLSMVFTENEEQDEDEASSDAVAEVQAQGSSGTVNPEQPTSDIDQGKSEKDIEITPAQAMLYETTRHVLSNGMKLLGLTPLEHPDWEPVRADTPITD